MMSLRTVNLSEVVRNQYLFKLKANIDSLSALILIQIVAIIMSMGGSNSYFSSSVGLELRVSYYSADAVIAFSMIWALTTAITITTKPNRHQDFTFVTNRLSSSLSNILFLLTACAVGGITAMLARYLPLALGSIFLDKQIYSLVTSPWDFLIGIGAAILYLFCSSAIGYFIGTLVQVSKLFIFLIPVSLIGILFVNALANSEPYFVYIYRFYLMEPSFGLFTLKIIITAAVFFFISIGILNRMEVRKWA